MGNQKKPNVTLTSHFQIHLSVMSFNRDILSIKCNPHPTELCRNFCWELCSSVFEGLDLSLADESIKTLQANSIIS